MYAGKWEPKIGCSGDSIWKVRKTFGPVVNKYLSKVNKLTSTFY